MKFFCPETKPGSCPVLDNVGLGCVLECQADQDCEGQSKCCTTTCGSVCEQPLLSGRPHYCITDTTNQLLLDIFKAGRVGLISGPGWAHFWTGLGSFLDRVGLIFGPCWAHFGQDGAHFLDHVWLISRPGWAHFWTDLGSFLDRVRLVSDNSHFYDALYFLPNN